MEQSGNKKKIIVAIVLLCVFALVISGLVGYRCGKRKIEKQHEYVEFYVRFIDRTTEETYDIRIAGNDEVRIPYDGLYHSFSYEVYTIKGKRCKELSNVYAAGNPSIKEPGQYSFYLTESVNGHSYDFRMVLIIEEPPKLQPEMKFEPNGAIEFVDGEYYKYKYTGFYCKPIAYAEYEGIRLEIVGEALIIYCKNNAIEGHSFAAPRDVGVYTVGFEIANYQDDPDRKIYNFVTKEIIIEIVE